jgi:ankyrin repeat protein
MTPEGKVKKRVKHVLNSFENVYFEMPVPTGYGKSGLDFSCCVNGKALFIETKAPGEEPTPRQRETMIKQLDAGATVFIISDERGHQALIDWLLQHTRPKGV